ncbi:dTDP-4-dehydrorhamnose reductase [Granulicella sp. 5B5]|uniref:dTDP-4-dehydrorhamnose reductase n=1 Tax=Granulicella sp. 5B5 TaxID=1617967 RepID=UPI0015F63236|nr:dTDP-4-dehydrorhamnose reductase [Granulicella sp. 5B5]QMV19098.1 dTDP-4-dehydrorhamnose reductase [Granulicella sp. 5B5]
MAGRILLTGVSGQVGAALLPLLQPMGEVVAPLRAELDLSDAEGVRRVVREVRPRWIVNPGAYTAVDKAEKEPELAYAVNRDAVRVLGEEAASIGAAVISFSTDYVFPGDGTKPWLETDGTGPLGVYGASKLAGEQALAASGAAYMVFRTSWVYGATGNNFLKTILRFAREKEEMKIVADQHGAPTWSEDLARLTVHVMKRMEDAAEGRSLADTVREAGGVYHACDAGETTWFGFASEFVRLAQLKEPEQRFARLLPIPSSEYPTPAKRPLNSRMNCEKLKKELGFTMPEWRESVAQVIERLG